MHTATTPSSPFSFVLVGAGSVGTAAAELLRRSGNRPIAVASRGPDSRARAAKLLGAAPVEVEEIPPADVVLLGVPDHAIEDVARALPSRGAGSVVVHFAGVFGITPLEPVIRAGALACALHPVQACPDFETAVARLPGSAWGVTATWPALEWARELVTGPLGGVPVDVAEDARPVWHAAAVSTSNGIAALMSVGETLLRGIGIESAEDILGPLAQGTVANARAGGGGGVTLTGPVVRGDLSTIARHIEGMRTLAPEMLPAYLSAARVVVEAAERTGRITSAEATEVRAVLEDAS